MPHERLADRADCWRSRNRLGDGAEILRRLHRPIPSIVTIVLALASFWMLSVAMKTLPVGTAYAVWVGIGALGTAIAAVFLFAEPVNTLRVAGVLLILAGVIALKLA